MLLRFVSFHAGVIRLLFVAIFVFSSVSGLEMAEAETFPADEKVGLLIMAHGGSDEWNRAVMQAAMPLQQYCPIDVAFGMAHPDSLQKAVTQLESQDVNKIAVVRLFISGNSFLQQTAYLLGQKPEPPKTFAHHHGSTHDKSGQDSTKVPSPVDLNSVIEIGREGLLDSDIAFEILVQRALELSVDAKNESVLFLAHGARSEEENNRWLARMGKLIQQTKEAGSFNAVRVETLREDWPEKRKQAEARIKEFVQKGHNNIGRTIVVPARVFGFGPYKKVLDGLDYVADGKGLLPHRLVTEWLRLQAQTCFERAGWENPFANQKQGSK
ncbi:MAG: hypothetical protein ACE5I1_21925 [bacterium]